MRKGDCPGEVAPVSLNTKIVIGAVAVGLVVAGSYFFGNLFRQRVLESGGIIKVEDHHKVAALIGVATLRALAGQEFPGDRGAAGPGLAYVLEAAGAGRCREVLITGLRIKGAYRCGKGDIANDILYLAADGTVDLCKNGDYQHCLVQNVSVIDKVR